MSIRHYRNRKYKMFAFIVLKIVCIPYLIIIIAFHLTSQTNALFTHSEQASGELTSANQFMNELDHDLLQAVDDLEIEISSLENHTSKQTKDWLEDKEQKNQLENEADVKEREQHTNGKEQNLKNRDSTIEQQLIEEDVVDEETENDPSNEQKNEDELVEENDVMKSEGAMDEG